MVMLPASTWRERASLSQLVELLGGDGATRAVGGAVRDTLLGMPVADVDLATVHPPEEAMRRLRGGGVRVVPTGLKHGTVTAVTGDGPVEVTTLRRDLETDGRRATVSFTGEWREDAARRDFTINALYASLGDGRVYDYFDGLTDLAPPRVRFIGDPLQRIAEDHLRILRFFRFHARFGTGAPDAAGLAACEGRANDLMALSRERIATELLRLLAVADPVPTMVLTIGRGIWRPVLPEFDANGAERLRALVAIEPEGDPVRRLAALVGPDPQRALDVAARLRLSNAQAKRLEVACGWREGGTPEAMAYRLGEQGAIDRLLLAGDAAAAGRIVPPPVFPLKGADLLKRGVAAGPGIGRALQRIEAAWIEGGFPQGPAFDRLVDHYLPG